MSSIGIDVHLRKSQVCILDEHGKQVKQTLVRVMHAMLRSGQSWRHDPAKTVAAA